MKLEVIALGAAAFLVFAGPSLALAQGVEGVDVSEFQGNVDWGQVKAAGLGFGMARVSDGEFHHDATFQRNWAGMHAQGLVRGVYQFFRASQDPTAQADLLVSEVGAFGPGDLPPVVDVEVMDGVSASTMATRLSVWVNRIKARTGLTPIVYTAPGFWDPLHASFGGETLWVANWFVSQPQLPSGWLNWTFWQYTDHGQVPGIPGIVDRDRFTGTLAQLQSYTHGAPPPGAGGTAPSGGGQPVLTFGARGPAVTLLQRLLDAAGDPTGAVDGIFGVRTLAAVKAFQTSHGLAPDGVVGPHTWAALLAPAHTAPPAKAPAPATKAPAPSTPAPAASPTLQQGSTGGAVVTLQQLLGAHGFNPGPVDGIFGPGTTRAVEAFQSSRGLAVDGIVGPQTWAALR